MKSDQIWLMYIDFETQFMHWGFINLLFFMAVQTPLVKHEEILDRYLDTVENFHGSIIEDIQSGQFQLPDRYTEQYTELGKSQFVVKNTRLNYAAAHKQRFTKRIHTQQLVTLDFKRS